MQTARPIVGAAPLTTNSLVVARGAFLAFSPAGLLIELVHRLPVTASRIGKLRPRIRYFCTGHLRFHRRHMVRFTKLAVINERFELFLGVVDGDDSFLRFEVQQCQQVRTCCFNLFFSLREGFDETYSRQPDQWPFR